MLRVVPVFFLIAASAAQLGFAAAPAQAGVDDLQRQAQAFAGVPVHLDSRLPVPDCPAGFQLRWLSAAMDRLDARCAATAWQMLIPVVRSQGGPKRGDLLRVEVRGEGYRAASEAVVESVDQRSGAVQLRNARSGVRFRGQLQEDGTVVVAGNGH